MKYFSVPRFSFLVSSRATPAALNVCARNPVEKEACQVERIEVKYWEFTLSPLSYGADVAALSTGAVARFVPQHEIVQLYERK